MAVEYALELNSPLWIMSMDLRKAFDTVDHEALFEALLSHGLEDPHVMLLRKLYLQQTGSANGSKSFKINSGVKQGDVLSAILFNCILDIAFERWKLRLTHERLFLGEGIKRLTNTRYADDILIYAESLSGLRRMVILLIEELESIGLHLNADKIKILHAELID